MPAAIPSAALSFREAVEASPDVVFLTDRNGVFTFVNHAFTRLYGYRPEEVVGRVTPRILEGGTTPSVEYETLWRRIVRGESVRVDFTNQTRDGRTVVVEVSVTPVRDDEGRIVSFAAVQRDVTSYRAMTNELRASRKHLEQLVAARNDAEARLREQMELLRALIDASPAAIVGIDRGGMVSLWNAAAERLFGWSASEVLGRPYPLVPDGAVHEFLEIVRRMAAGQPAVNVRTRRACKDGTLVEVALSAGAVRDADGTAAGFIATLVDEREQAVLEQQLRQAQKMEAVGRLAGGVAHDFNNLLTLILGYTDFLLATDLPADTLELLGEVRRAGERANALTRQLLAFSRQSVLAPRIINLNDAVCHSERMLRRLIGEDIAFVTRLDPALGCTRADPAHIEQVLMNLAVNARDAMPDGGTLTIDTWNETTDESADHAAGCVVLRVRDTGIGMDDETRSRVFEPFFTTKGNGRGTGLGLATVYGIVTQGGGDIRVASAPEEGTTFEIRLPAVNGVPTAEVVEPTKPLPSGRETVLLVEDEPGVRLFTRRALAECGYDVLEAEDGAHALEIVAAHPGPIHLLLTDVVLPGLNGRELARRVTALTPGMGVLYMSGYAADAAGHALVDEGAPFLQKPYSSHDLAEKVRTVLDRPSSRL